MSEPHKVSEGGTACKEDYPECTGCPYVIRGCASQKWRTQMDEDYSVKIKVRTEESAVKLASILVMNDYWVHVEYPKDTGGIYLVETRLSEGDVERT
jgi:hypothetical protein